MGGMEVNRLALNIDQIEQYGPPPNPAKLTDSRAVAYIAEFGDDSWELDALEPSVIDDLIDTHVQDILDRDEWDETCSAEELAREGLTTAAERWSDVQEYLAR